MRRVTMPVVFTVGQVLVFPYYILWLRELSYTYTLFALLFALHSFAAAAGYMLFTRLQIEYIRFVYFSTGIIYIAVLFVDDVFYVVLIQVLLGLLQGYFRAWHIQQKSYKLNAVQHYIIVGLCMLALAFVQVILPSMLIASFGLIVCIAAFFTHERSKTAV